MKKKIGIALSGGGMRGIAHIGVLQALIEHDIYPSVVSGTSAGSIIGAMYAAGKTPLEMMDFVKKSSLFKVLKPGFPFNGLTSHAYLKEMLAKYIDDDSFEKLELPLYIVVTNLNSGKEEWIHTGDLLDVVIASCSIPLIFKPVNINGKLYVDGGVMNNLPATPLVGKCDVLIGSNVMPLNENMENRSFNSVLGIAVRIFELSIWNNTMASLFHLDILIEPKNINEANTFSLSHADITYQKGYEAAMEQMDSLLELCL
jgi:NTE family protein